MNEINEKSTLNLPMPLIEDIRRFQEQMLEKYNYHCHIYVKDRNMTLSVPKTTLRSLWNHICDIAYDEHKILLDSNRHCRKRLFVTYRQIYSYIARKKGYSLSSIGRTISKDHATIMNNLRVFKNLREMGDPELIPVYHLVIEQLKVRINAADIEFSNRDENANEPGSLLISYQ